MSPCFYLKISRRVMGTFFVYIAYLLFGSLTFLSIEADFHRMVSFDAETLAADIIKALEKENFTDDEIYRTLMMRQSDINSQTESRNYGWHVQYGSKVYFSFFLLTTTGYGNVFPKSSVGQIVCIIYLVMGRPLHVIMMRLLSLEFRKMLRKAITAAQSIRLKCKFLFTFAVTIYHLWWLTIFLFIPSYIFTLSEDWTYITGIYYSFLTLTSSAMGDYVAAISSDHFDDPYFSLNLILMFLWMFLGLGFAFSTCNLISYMMGSVLVDAVDSQCQTRAIIKRQMRNLSELFKDLNWQLVKYKPEKFQYWKEIENFNRLLTTDPETITEGKMQEMFDIVIDLKKKAFVQLSSLQPSHAHLKPIIEHTHDDLPDALSKDSTIVKFTEYHAGYPTGGDSSTEHSYGRSTKTSLIDLRREELLEKASKSDTLSESTSDTKVIAGQPANKGKTTSEKDEELKTILYISDDAESNIKEASEEVEQNQKISLAEVNEDDIASGKDEVDAIKKSEDETESESADLEDSGAKLPEKTEKKS